MTFKPGQQPEMKQEREQLPVLNVLADWKFLAQDVFGYLSLS